MNFLFFGSRVLPAVCLLGAAHLVFVNTFFPMSDEERQKLDRIRAEKRAMMKSMKPRIAKPAYPIPSIRNDKDPETNRNDPVDLEGSNAKGEDIVEMGSVSDNPIPLQDRDDTAR